MCVLTPTNSPVLQTEGEPPKNSENSEFCLLKNETNDDKSPIQSIGLAIDRNILGDCL